VRQRAVIAGGDGVAVGTIQSGRSSSRNRLMLVRLFSPLAFAVCLLLSLPAPSAAAEQGMPDREVEHVLNRVAFGPARADLEHVEAIGIDRYIDEQLHPEAIPENPELTQRLAGLDTLKLDPVQLFTEYGPLTPVQGSKPDPEEAKARRERARIIVQQASDARVLRALLSRRQLQEVMVDFWFNHFNVFVGKGLDHLWIGDYENAAIRPYALGHFRDLLLATARHPAMLVYLDNAENTAPGSPGARGKEVGLNENYAREVMELHTLGADGGYTQQDVVTLARVLTGWGINRRDLRDGTGPASGFDPSRHDFAGKEFLGKILRQSGEAEAVEALDRLARSPATARHIGFELAQYFVADAPPAALVEQLAARFRETDGDIRAVLKALFASREFRDSIGAKYKTPYQFVISVARAAGVPVRNPRPLLGAMNRMGMRLYGCQTPDGYKNTGDAWLSPDAATLRISFATAYARGGLPIGTPLSAPPAPQPALLPAAAPGAAAPGPAAPAATEQPRGEPVDAAQLARLLGPMLSRQTSEVVAEAPAGLRGALILGSPDFMRR